MLHYLCNAFLSTWISESDGTHQISTAQLECDPEADLRMGPLGHPGVHLWTQSHSSAYVHAPNLLFEWSSQVLIFCLKLLTKLLQSVLGLCGKVLVVGGLQGWLL